MYKRLLNSQQWSEKYEIGNKTSPQQQMFFSHKTTLDSPKDLIHVVEIIENIWLATKITRTTIINITIEPYDNRGINLGFNWYHLATEAS